jgi:hypothetical protein
MQNLTWIGYLQLRASYGITGNSPSPGTAASFDIAGPNPSPLFPGGALTITTPANKTLTWEETKTINLGLDFSVMRDRLKGSINLYQKKTSNLIGYLPLNIFTTYSSITGNYGNMANKGVEISINSVNIATHDFSWISTLNLAYNKNRITKLTSNAPITAGSQLISFTPYLVGYATPAIFAYPFAGLDDNGNAQIRLKDRTITSSNAATVTPADMVYKGPSQPAWNGGLNNSFSYKHFTLSANIVFNAGFVMRRDVNYLYTGPITADLPTEFGNRWQRPGDEKTTNVPSYVSPAADGARSDAYYTLGDINVVDASYAKLRDLTLAYSLPADWCKKAMMQSVSFRIGISNVMLWKANHYGIDPEFQQSSYLGTTTGFFGGIRTMPVNQHMMTAGAHITF